MRSALPAPNGRAHPGAAIVFDEIGALGDRRGVAYSLKCAALALASANDAAMMLLRPAPQNGGAA